MLKKISGFLVLPIAVACSMTFTNCAPAEGEGEGEGEGEEGEGEGEGEPECAAVDDAACLDGDELCDTTGGVCTTPDAVTDDCADFGYEAGGPIVYDVEEISTGDTGENCDADVATYIATIRVNGGGTMGTSLYTQEIIYINSAGTAGLSYSEDPATGDLVPALDDLGDGDYLVTFYLCGAGGGGDAIAFANDAGDQGNAFCF